MNHDFETVCPECGAIVKTTVQDVARQNTVGCRLGHKITLKDQGGGARRAQKLLEDLDRPLKDLGKSAGRFRRQLDETGSIAVRLDKRMPYTKESRNLERGHCATAASRASSDHDIRGSRRGMEAGLTVMDPSCAVGAGPSQGPVSFVEAAALQVRPPHPPTGAEMPLARTAGASRSAQSRRRRGLPA